MKTLETPLGYHKSIFCPSPNYWLLLVKYKKIASIIGYGLWGTIMLHGKYMFLYAK
jgi:hypothetical protein